MLEHGGGDHRERREAQARRDFLDGGKSDIVPSEEWIEKLVADGDEDKNCDRLQVGNDVVRHAVQLHGARLSDESPCLLIKRQPVDG